MDLILENARLVTSEQGDVGYMPTSPKNIVIESGLITSIVDSDIVHKNPELYYSEKAKQPQKIDCCNKLVTSGLIDCHTHLVYAGNRANEFEMRLNGMPYQEIASQGGGILSTVKSTRNASIEQLVELALPRVDGLLASGVTTIEVKSGYGLTLEDELKMLQAAKVIPHHRKVNITTTLLAAHALPPEYQDADRYIDYVCDTIIPNAAEQGLVDAVDVFCESVGFNLKQTEQVFQAAANWNLPIKGHTEQLSNLGGSALAAKYGALSVDHIEYLDAEGVIALSEFKTVATILPGAYYFLKETQQPPIDLLRKFNVPMAIATDLNPGTSPFADLRLMMNMACTLFGMTPEEAFRGVTVNAAKALGKDKSIGQIGVGYNADLAIWNVEHPADLSYLVGVPNLSSRIVNGELAHA